MPSQKTIIGGMKWTALSTGYTTITQIIVMVVLARILSPEDFGVMALLMVVIGFCQAFMDMGFSNVIIQRKEISEIQLSSLYWLNIFAGLVLSCLLFFASPFLSKFYNNVELENALKLLSSVFILIALGNQHRALAQKEMRFKATANIEITAATATCVISIVLAYAGAGVYALIGGILAQASVTGILFFLVGMRYHRPLWRYNHKSLQGLFGFGLYQAGEKAINYLNSNADNILIGRMLGMVPLGYYNIAWQLCMLPLQRMNTVINKVAYPQYAVSNNDHDVTKKYEIFMRITAVTIVPMMVFVFYFSSSIVPALYGNGWATTATLLPPIALIAILKSFGSAGGPLFLAYNRPDIGFFWNILWLGVVVVGLAASMWLYPSIEYVVWLMLALIVPFSIIWHVMIMRIINIKYNGILKHCGRAVMCSFLSGYAVLKLLELYAANMGHVVFSIMALILCLFIYGFYMYFFEKDLPELLKQGEQ